MDEVVYFVCVFVCGLAVGYALCRRTLFAIAKHIVTPQQHADLFGYPLAPSGGRE